MATPAYIAVLDPATGNYRVRVVVSDGYPTYLVPTLRRIWAHTYHTDTRRWSRR